MAFRASPEDVVAGLAAQKKVLAILCEYHDQGWMESRDLIQHRNPGMSAGDLNFEEKKAGDLVNPALNMAMEVQHSERTDNCLWTLSKAVHCRADWQCFSFAKHNAFLVVRSNVVRDYLNEWKVKPTKGEGDSYFTLGIDFLEKLGAQDLIEWCEESRIPIVNE